MKNKKIIGKIVVMIILAIILVFLMNTETITNYVTMDLVIENIE